MHQFSDAAPMNRLTISAIFVNKKVREYHIFESG